MKPPTTAMLRFGVVGLLNTSVNYGAYVLLLRANVPYVTAAVLGFFAGVGTSYAINRRWTFGCRTAPNAAEASRFVLVNLVTLGVYASVAAFAGEILRWPPRAAWLAAMLIAFPVNFIGSQWWAFRPEANAS